YYCSASHCVQKGANGASCNGNNQCLSNACCGNVCVDLSSNISNCGSCGTVCGNAHGTTSCSGGQCAPVCSGFWGDCDGNRPNGCETATDTTTNCGGCGIPCSRSNAFTSCPSGACTLGSCFSGYANCDGNNNNGCERFIGGHSNSSPGQYLGSFD